MRRISSLLLAATVLAGGLASAILAASPAGATVPADFTDELVASIGGPTGVAFTPDGRILATTQGGTLRVVQNGTLLPTPAVDLASVICTNSERGVLGVAVDPAFATNGYVFLYYSFNKVGDCGTGTVNRVARFVMTGNTLGGQVVLIDNIPSPAGNHNGGDLQFGKDGLLYVSVGDGGCDYPGGTPSGCGAANDASRDRNVLLGKIVRIDRDGNIPAGNPFTGGGTARCNVGGAPVGQICQETFAWGLRNPFRIAFDPNPAGTVFHINDVGQSAWEEIDLGTSGADYGWNVREGHCVTGSTTNCGPPPAGMTNPIFDYGRADGCRSITGGAFVPSGTWPIDYQGKYLFADYGCGKIFRLDPNGVGGFTRVDFATGLGGNSAVHLAFGPANGGQALYYTSYASGGQVRRIVHTPPAAAGTDRGVYRNGAWYVEGQPTAFFGLAGDIPVPGDYDGDGDIDRAVYRNGAWYVDGQATVYLGLANDVPVPADYDGDGDTDRAVFRNGSWYVDGLPLVSLGQAGDIPVPGDYNGDGDAERAVFRDGAWFTEGLPTVSLGLAGDIPVPGDYDGDIDTDRGVYRGGAWHVEGQATVYLGLAGQVPEPGDYDGNGTTDRAVFHQGAWYTQSQPTVYFGLAGDVPLPLPQAIYRRFF